jgi:hypothetical protein
MAYVMAGNEPLSIPGPVEPIALLLFFLVIGEEIGWRRQQCRRFVQGLPWLSPAPQVRAEALLTFSYEVLGATSAFWPAWP